MPNETYLVKIGSVTFSDDGSPTGAACLTSVEGLDSLFLNHVGATRLPLTGKPFNFVKQNLRQGVRLISRPFSVSESVLNSLKTIIDTANSGSSAISVEVSDGPMSVNVDCDPLFEGGEPPISWKGDHFNTELYNVQVRLITRGLTP